MADAPKPPNPDVNVNSALPDDVRESVAVANLKAYGDAPATLMNLAVANAVALQQAMGQLGMTILAKAVDAVNRPGTENAALVAAMAQILTKTGQSTPPETAKT